MADFVVVGAGVIGLAVALVKSRHPVYCALPFAELLVDTIESKRRA
jgi:glycine/D-amino acid oxidase-like deaminating enzyme